MQFALRFLRYLVQQDDASIVVSIPSVSIISGAGNLCKHPILSQSKGTERRQFPSDGRNHDNPDHNSFDCAPQQLSLTVQIGNQSIITALKVLSGTNCM